MKYTALIALFMLCGAQLIKVGTLVFLSEAAYAADWNDDSPEELHEDDNNQASLTKKRMVMQPPTDR
jgi:hypothetical protein